jgi:hypothetical protein
MKNNPQDSTTLLHYYKKFLNACIFGGSIFLTIAALILLVKSASILIAPLLQGTIPSTVILQAIELIVVSIAVLDVGKYIAEEEVQTKKELRTPAEARKTLTKFLVIIIIAISLEALLYIFEAGHTDLQLLIYPTLLVVATVFLIVGLALFQKISVASEEKISQKEVFPKNRKY